MFRSVNSNADAGALSGSMPDHPGLLGVSTFLEPEVSDRFGSFCPFAAPRNVVGY
jgi:hypothetical protein